VAKELTAPERLHVAKELKALELLHMAKELKDSEIFMWPKYKHIIIGIIICYVRQSKILGELAVRSSILSSSA